MLGARQRVQLRHSRGLRGAINLHLRAIVTTCHAVKHICHTQFTIINKLKTTL
jgi:hypothetical protein